MIYAVEIIDKKTANETNNVHIMYTGAGRDVWSGLGVTAQRFFIFIYFWGGSCVRLSWLNCQLSSAR